MSKKQESLTRRAHFAQGRGSILIVLVPDFNGAVTFRPTTLKDNRLWGMDGKGGGAKWQRN